MLTLPAGRRSKYVVLVLAALFFIGLASFAGKFEGVQKNETSSFLPGDAESVKALEAIQKLPGGELAPAVVAFERPGGLTDADRERITETRTRLNQDRRELVLEAQEPVFSENGKAALIVQPVRPGDGTGDKFELAVQSIADRAGESEDGLEVRLTGAAGFSLDAIKVFGGVNGPLLFAAAGIVLVLLIAIYRSPIFWAIPFFTVLLAEGASRGAGYLLAEAGLTINGQTGGILPVLVFGAGTDYALLLVSRYREELRRHDDKHEAVAIAMKSAGPAIIASGMTVIAALLCLSLADVNSTAGLGPVGAVGIALAMISMLTILPALLAITGRNAFWSPGMDTIPHTGQTGSDETHGFWRRVGDRVARRPRAIWIVGTIILLILAANVAALDTGQTTGDQFRGEVDSVTGQEMLTRNFSAGASAPTDVVVTDRSRVEDVTRAAGEFGQVLPGPSNETGTQLTVTLRDAPYSTAALDTIPRLREAVGEGALVGGPSAQEYELREAATRDNKLIIPLTLVVVFGILMVLLRAVVAPLVLIASVIVSFAAALGTGIFVSDHIFGFTGVGPTLPLLAFVFLVALGIDYNIFLMARVREEAHKHGTREGTLRGLAVTGAVITGAGIVLAGTFGALAVLPLVVLTQIGFIVSFGVLLDTFVVRSVIVPAAVIDVGRRVWWPSRLARESRDSAQAPTE
ncbi:MMPL family transporter [Solirubrobacter phytolaccae]|uniref:MMPL family transporter n=1 Tax=Solirubrobacter phytolaccae TaxID=1404360 RepID=A0A9X3S617_9ACTN|nr:MMPL family transporter [Solirubrobacter phytolaccae]MDA0179539.1 MMPL family transporter [Solirubrobacter phytolaccae]